MSVGHWGDALRKKVVGAGIVVSVAALCSFGLKRIKGGAVGCCDGGLGQCSAKLHQHDFARQRAAIGVRGGHFGHRLDDSARSTCTGGFR